LTFELDVTAEFILWTCGMNLSFVYNGVSITYGTVQKTISGISYCWLDRNLGAIRAATSSDDTQVFGDLFQWGRLADGHQIRTSGTTSNRSGSDVPGHANFITRPSSPYDWGTPQKTGLWQGETGVNNPCPAGW